MGDMLSQAEIDALLGGGDGDDNTSDANQTSDNSEISRAVPKTQEEFMESKTVGELEGYLNDEQKDIMGEIGNISMGTSATTLYALLNQKVLITTPKVKVVYWKELTQSYDRPCVGIRVDYKEGIKGSNVLILKQQDVKVIADLMMGGTGDIAEDFELNDIDLSAIAEAMNQMVGSASTSMSSMLNHKVDIDTPHAFILDFQNDNTIDRLGFSDDIAVVTAFRMEIGNLIDSEIMQVLPVDFAKEMINTLRGSIVGEEKKETPKPVAEPTPAPAPKDVFADIPVPDVMPQPQPVPQVPQQQMYQQPIYQQPMPQYVQQPMPQQNVNVQPVQFPTFVDPSELMQQKENIGIIMDVPLEITVELGRTHKLIKEILDFSPGTVIELDKVAGEPIDILVNGKFIAKGEVVVIDENFGIRITEIVKPEERI